MMIEKENYGKVASEWAEAFPNIIPIETKSRVKNILAHAKNITKEGVKYKELYGRDSEELDISDDNHWGVYWDEKDGHAEIIYHMVSKKAWAFRIWESDGKLMCKYNDEASFFDTFRRIVFFEKDIKTVERKIKTYAKGILFFKDYGTDISIEERVRRANRVYE